MTVGLGPNRIDRARKEPRSFLRSLKRELDAKLYRRLARKPDYWFIVETSVTSSPWHGKTKITPPHIHGVIGAASDELEAVEERSEEHTSELQSLMRISYAVFCLKKKTNTITRNQ